MASSSSSRVTKGRTRRTPRALVTSQCMPRNPCRLRNIDRYGSGRSSRAAARRRAASQSAYSSRSSGRTRLGSSPGHGTSGRRSADCKRQMNHWLTSPRPVGSAAPSPQRERRGVAGPIPQRQGRADGVVGELPADQRPGGPLGDRRRSRQRYGCKTWKGTAGSLDSSIRRSGPTDSRRWDPRPDGGIERVDVAEIPLPGGRGLGEHRERRAAGRAPPPPARRPPRNPPRRSGRAGCPPPDRSRASRSR